MTARKKICLFGLSADPPTGYGGHVGIVQALKQMEEWDEIWVLPVYRHTFAEKRKRLVSYEHRMKMCQLAFLPLNDETATTTIVISDAEFLSWQHAVQHLTNDEEKMEVSVGTAVLLDFLRNSHENCEFYFCLGGDSFIDLVQGKWQQTDRILNNLLLSQEGDASQPLSRRLLVLYRSVQHGEDHDLLIRQYAKELGVRLIQISHLGNVSSTQVRNCDDIVQLQSSHQMILPQVLEYIQAHGLYQFCK